MKCGYLSNFELISGGSEFLWRTFFFYGLVG